MNTSRRSLVESFVARYNNTTQRQTFNVFHYKIRQIVIGRAAVKQLSDIRMMKAGENLPFIFETANNLFVSGQAGNKF